MDKKTTVLLCIIALLAGSVFYFWANSPDVAQEARYTDQIVSDIEDTLESVTARIASQDSKVRTEVRYVYEKTRTKINALPADAICADLNAELALFRGMEASTGRLDDE